MFLSRYWPNFCFKLIIYSLGLIQNNIEGKTIDLNPFPKQNKYI